MSRHQGLSLLMLVVLAVVVVIVLRGFAETPRPAQEQPATAAPQPVAPAPVTPAATEAQPSGPSITRITLDGQDVADALNLPMWKFRFNLSRGEYTNHVWMERWKRGAERPDVRLLSMMSDTWSQGDLVVELPTERDPQPFIRIGASSSRATGVPPVPPPTAIEVLEEEVLLAGEDVYLLTMTYDSDGRPTGGRRDVHGNHDETIYIKTRFVPGFLVPFDPVRSNVPAEPSAPAAPPSAAPAAEPAPTPPPAPAP